MHATGDTSREATLEFRRIEPRDGPDLLASFELLSEEARFARFFYHKHRFGAHELELLTHCDGVHQAALIALAPTAVVSPLVAVARWIRDEKQPTLADVASITRDDWQRRGLGRRLIRLLADDARAQGITHFRAQILAGNTAARKILAAAGVIESHEPFADGAAEFVCRLTSPEPRGA